MSYIQSTGGDSEVATEVTCPRRITRIVLRSIALYSPTARRYGVADSIDCDPADPAVGGPPDWYPDADGDSYGDETAPSPACSSPGADWLADGTDCDDADPAVNPAATEVWYDGVDQDCDGNDDDQDGDGLARADDCDDTDPLVGSLETLARTYQMERIRQLLTEAIAGTPPAVR